MRHYYFAYGSNMNPERVKLRELPVIGFEAAKLHGYQMAFNKRSTIYPGAASANIIEATDGVVEGLLYELADESSINVMDPFEGYPVRYDRFLVEVQTQNGLKTTWTYSANADYIQEGLKPARWYLDHLLAGQNYLSRDYYERLVATECLVDSDIEPT